MSKRGYVGKLNPIIMNSQKDPQKNKNNDDAIENKKDSYDDGTVLASGDPHQQEELDQATDASAASFTLEPEKGIPSDSKDKEEEEDNGKKG